jgi:4-oxalocrotonate tautomerase
MSGGVPIIPRYTPRADTGPHRAAPGCRVLKLIATLPGSIEMPAINVKVIEGVFSPAQKKQIAEKLTDTMVAIEGEALRPYTLVVIEEVRSGDWAVGGRTLTTADVAAIAGKKAA